MADARLLFGDCREQLRYIESDSVDLVVTSPPYANQRSTTYGGVKPDEYADWFLPIADQLYRVLKPTGTFILNIKEPAINGERHTCVIEIMSEMRKRGWLGAAGKQLPYSTLIGPRETRNPRMLLEAAHG